MDGTRLPFDIEMKSMETFGILDAGYNYSYAGMAVHFSRNGIGTLLGGFYAPTTVFQVLSLISFNINPEVVSQIFSQTKGKFEVKLSEFTIYFFFLLAKHCQF